MKKNATGILAVLFSAGLICLMTVGACEEITEAAEGVCGDCGTIENGDATISGMAELDGIFKAVGTIDVRTGTINASFDARVRAMAEQVFDIDVSAMATAEVVAAIETAFDAWITANVDGGLKIAYEGPKCTANIDVAVSAQAQCEAKAGCDVDVKCDPGQASFECSGKCEGSCSAECSAPTCTVKIEGSASCEGTCEGSCTVEVTGTAGCEGKCEGDCSGECSAYDGEGNCSGSCSGNCTGSCTVEGSAAAECSGSCSGSCKAEGTAEAECEGSFGCSGECSGECSGGCEGEVKAPSCEGNAECDASVDCEAQASAQASASLKCTPPSLKIDFAFAAGLDAGAEAEFMAKLNNFKAHFIAIAQGAAELRALVDADYAASIGIEPPTVAIGVAIEEFITAIGNGELEIEAPGLVPCAIPALEESAEIVASVAGDMATTIELQVRMVGLLM